MPLEDPARVERRLWFVTTFLSVVFLSAGLVKWLRLALVVELFRRFGLPAWTLPVVGTLEIGFTALLLNPATRPYGAMGLGLVMAGAVFTHVMTGVALPMLFINALLFTGCVWVVMKHRPAFMRLA